MAEEPKPSSEKQKKKEPLAHVEMSPIKKVNGLIVTVRRKAQKVLTTVILSGVVGTAAGHVAGSEMKKAYGFKDEVTLAEPLDKEGAETEGGAEDKGTYKGINKLAKRLGKEGARVLKKAKETVKKTDLFKDTTDKIIKLQKATNRALYWGAFFPAFLLAAFITSMAIKAKRAFTQSAAPVVDQNFKITQENLKRLEQNLNATVNRINEIYDIVTSKRLTMEGEDALIEESRALTDKVIKLKAEVDALKAGGNPPTNTPQAEDVKNEATTEENSTPGGLEGNSK